MVSEVSKFSLLITSSAYIKPWRSLKAPCHSARPTRRPSELRSALPNSHLDGFTELS
ncbi:MAG: hypothetical protein ACJA1R_002976 [Flavobacteriales bacterium]